MDLPGFDGFVQNVGRVLELAGVLVILAAATLVTVLYARDVYRKVPAARAFQSYRQRLGQGILLGLEFLVAGDIIRTIAVAPSFQSVGLLAVIVAVRTFLSLALEVEINGRFPWSAAPAAQTGDAPTT
jgi:uncharacterized membrane protein